MRSETPISASSIADSADGASPQDLRVELLSRLAEWNVGLPRPVQDDAPLISSGAMDSLALFNLVLWVEEKTGHAVEPNDVDLAAEWDSVRLILRYLERPRPPVGSRASAAPAPRRAIHVPGVRIVRYSAEYKAAVAELQTRLWSPHVNLNLRYFAWKYEQNPYAAAAEPRIYLALAEGELVGMRGFYPSRWESGLPAQFEDVLVADDLLLREDHRNEGLVTRIMREALDDLKGRGTGYVFNLSASRLTVLGSFAMAWRSPGHLAPVGRLSWAHSLRIALRERCAGRPLLWRYADSAPFANRHPFRHLDRRLGVFTTANGVAVDVAADPRPSAMARFVNSQPYAGGLRHVRDEAYFLWRFRNPLHEYRFFYVGGEALDGYLVAKCALPAARSSPRVHIMDAEATDVRTASALLDAVVDAGRCDELVVWSGALAPGFRPLLDRFGFEPVDQHLAPHGLPRILVRPIDDSALAGEWRINGRRLLDFENWDMRMMYSMAG